MKKKDKQQIRSKSIVELSQEIAKRQEEIFKLSIEIKTAKIKNTSLLRRRLDELALVKTILQEKKFLA